MSLSKPKKPKEPPESKALRARQVADLTKLDEDENRRIKTMLRARTGGRAFRSPGSPRAAANTKGSLVSPTGFPMPALSGTRGGGGGARGGGYQAP